MATIELTLDKKSHADAHILLTSQSGQEGYKAPDFLGFQSSELDSLKKKLSESKHFFGKKNQISLLRYYKFHNAASVLLVGLGKKQKLETQLARRLGALVGAAQKKERLSLVLMDATILHSLEENPKPRYPLLQAFLEGYLLSFYEFREFKKKPDPKTSFEEKGIIIVSDKSHKEAFETSISKAKILCEAIYHARRLGDLPGNGLTPEILANEAKSMASKKKIKCTIFNKAQIAKEKMGLFLGVAQGSIQDPRFIILEYNGTHNNKSSKPIALVGKGITFDSGGISLKPPPQMEDMKYDMSGAALVLSAIYAASDLKLPVHLVALVPATENMPGGKAQKPGDIQKSISGKTVEITNTDAEGRLILADALEYAQQNFDPQAILDFATLTGAVTIALGSEACGIMGNSSNLIEKIKKSANTVGERVWELPLFEEYQEDLKSNYADIRNAGNREAGSSKGGTFLQFFVDNKYPWVHFDIAGVAYHVKDKPEHPGKYATGQMLLTLIYLLEHWSE